MNDMTPPGGPVDGPEPDAKQSWPVQVPSYDASAGDLAKIAISNGLLSLVTLGIYRFWGKTRLRRYLWGRVEYLGDRLEYSGTGKELFLGFLVALVILTPLFGGNIAVDILYAEDLNVKGVKDLIFAVVFLFLIHLAIYRARRYRLARSQWRGIRAGQDGSSFKYALLALGWGLVVALTLGLAYNVYRTRIQAYKMSHTWFGDRRFSFDGRASDLFGIWFLTWLFLIPTLGLIYVWYRVREFRYFLSRTGYGALGFKSALSTGSVFVIFFFYYMAVAVILGVIFTFGGALLPEGGLAGLLAPGADPEAVPDLKMAAVLAFVALMAVVVVAMGVLRVLFFLHPLLRVLCHTLTVTGEEDFAAIAQSQQSVPGRGEGLADTLDVGEF